MTLNKLYERLESLEKILCSKRWSMKATHEWLEEIDKVKTQIKELENA